LLLLAVQPGDALLLLLAVQPGDALLLQAERLGDALLLLDVASSCHHEPFPKPALRGGSPEKLAG
jgi:hypothetical protein